MPTIWGPHTARLERQGGLGSHAALAEAQRLDREWAADPIRVAVHRYEGLRDSHQRWVRQAAEITRWLDQQDDVDPDRRVTFEWEDGCISHCCLRHLIENRAMALRNAAACDDELVKAAAELARVTRVAA